MVQKVDVSFRAWWSWDPDPVMMIVSRSMNSMSVFVCVAAPPVTVKVESRVNSPLLVGEAKHRPGGETKSHSLHVSSKSGSCRTDADACCVKPGRARCSSPRPVDDRKHRPRTGSRSPTTSHRGQSHDHYSQHSVDIKTECTTPTLHKKSSRYVAYCRPCVVIGYSLCWLFIICMLKINWLIRLMTKSF